MLFKELNRIQRIDQFIRMENTGNAEEFADKLGISRKQVYNIIDDLKDMGLDIVYDRQMKSFVYTKAYRINILFEIQELSADEARKVSAGVVIMKNTFLCNAVTQTIYSFGNSKLLNL